MSEPERCGSLGTDQVPQPEFQGEARGEAVNNTERGQWIDNDEGLYDWWRSSGLSKREFIRQNRAEIDAAIESVTGGSKPAHYLKYGG